MARKILFILYEDSEINTLDNYPKNTKVTKMDIFQSFYRVKLTNIPEKISPEEFGETLLNPDWTQLTQKFLFDTLVLAGFPKDRIGYIGIVRDVVSRNSSIEIPAELTWEEFLECARQTDKSSIRFQ